MRILTGSAGGAIGFVIDHALGLQLAHTATPSSTSGAQLVSGLQTGLLTAVIALLLYLRDDSEPDLPMLVTYSAFSVVLLTCLASVFLIRGHRRNNEPDSHAFDRGSVVLARWCVLAWILLESGITYGYWNRLLPGQRLEEVRLSVAKVESYVFKNATPSRNVKKGDLGADLIVPVRATDFGPRPYLELTEFVVTFSPRAAEDWQIVDAYDGTAPDGQPAPPDGDLPPSPPKLIRKGPPFEIVWSGLRADHNYVLVIRLRKAGKQTREQLVDTVNKEDVGITIKSTRRK